MPKLWIGDEQKRSEKFQETGSATDVIISDLISAISYAEDTQFIADGCEVSILAVWAQCLKKIQNCPITIFKIVKIKL